MRLRLFALTLLAGFAARSNAAEPSLEGMNAAAVDTSVAEPKQKIDKGPAHVDTGDSKPAPQMDLGPAIDIKSNIKRVTEPNLFSGAAPNVGTLRNLASGEAPEEYEVKEGDNLYDICDQLIDEPNYWPKLWAFNPDITNPNFVYPGMKLRFFAGDDETPPFLQVVSEDDILPVSKGKVVESELVRENIDALLMRSEAPENIAVIDPKDMPRDPRIEEDIFDAGGKFDLDTKQVVIPAWIVEEDFDALGTVIGGSAGSFLVDKDQMVIVKQNDALKVGATYTVVRKGEKIVNEKKDAVGVRYEFVAHLKLLQVDKEDSDIFKGKVVFNKNGIQPGDILIPLRNVKRRVPRKPETEIKGAEQMVVGFTEPHTHIGGRGDIVFIDQSEGKLKEKGTYRIIQNVKVPALGFISKNLPDTDSQVAHVYILDTSGSAAVGYLLHDSLEVRNGDRVSP